MSGKLFVSGDEAVALAVRQAKPQRISRTPSRVCTGASWDGYTSLGWMSAASSRRYLLHMLLFLHKPALMLILK